MSYKKEPQPERNEKGLYYMTEKYCVEICEFSGFYSTPHHNASLLLNFKGFSKIENLEAFVNVKVLYLENNCIKKIENISHMKYLSCL
jgi:hypothetical protein